jgi:hypothetical protein
MYVHYPDLDVDAAIDVSTPSRSIATMFEERSGSATMNATQREPDRTRARSGNAVALGATDWLSLAAAPTFAIMALLTGVLGGGAPDTLCSVAQGASPLSRMAAMYLLMSVFHSAPWLKLVSQGRPFSSSGRGSRKR